MNKRRDGNPEASGDAPEQRVRPPFASDEKRKQAVELFKEGVGYVRASRILNMPANTLRDWSIAFRAGKFQTTLSPHLYRYSDEVRTEVIRMRLTGSTWNEIMDETGVLPTTARRWINAYTKKHGRKSRIALAAELKEQNAV